MPSLADLLPGQQAVVTDIEGDDAITTRLYEMGLIPGCRARFLGAAPLGDPLEFEIRHYRLSLRKDEARRVGVTLD
ncbi:MAG TPA: ferrous iron transport protein A [Pirellulaceae bacterium]|nr:ferrous iron transport protein A [Pirellulaceae bacterium]HMO92017.1 ferrous iron transport protein A [Pirellulaceae bacterium]HMP68816.1 ferrous iron transport protein A [Pirellulaceae bacterium]